MADFTLRNNERLVRILNPEIRTGSTNSRDLLTPLGQKGIMITVDVTAVGAGQLRPRFQYKDSAGTEVVAGPSNYHHIFQPAVNITALGKYIYIISPDAVAWPDITEVLQSPIPTITRMRMIHSQPGESFDYSVWGEYF